VADQTVSANPTNLQYVPVTFSFGATKPSPYSIDHATFEYSNYVIRTAYHIESGVKVMASGGVNGTTPANNEIIREHNGQAWKRVYFTGQRIGAKLVLPSPNTNNPNEILEETVIEAEVPMQQPNIQIQHVTGYYLYGLVQPLDITTDTLPMGVTPADTNIPSAISQNIVPADFSLRPLNAAHAVPKGFQLGIPINGPAEGG
jgi:hypothetical protein